MIKAADISACGRYRYTLDRRWAPGGSVLWVMLNPSTADANRDDQTIRKCIGFTQRWGFGALRAVNLFALRSTDPRDLLAADDPAGPRNLEVLRAEPDSGHERIVVAWGVPDPERDALRHESERGTGPALAADGWNPFSRHVGAVALAHADGIGPQQQRLSGIREDRKAQPWHDADGRGGEAMAYAHTERRGEGIREEQDAPGIAIAHDSGDRTANANGASREGRCIDGYPGTAGQLRCV